MLLRICQGIQRAYPVFYSISESVFLLVVSLDRSLTVQNIAFLVLANRGVLPSGGSISFASDHRSERPAKRVRPAKRKKVLEKKVLLY